jgi:hypothetical protein
MVEVHKGIGGPQPGVQIFPRDDFSGTLEEHCQHLKGLFLKANLEAVAAELPDAKVYLKDSKADNSVCGISCHWAHLAGAPYLITVSSGTKFPLPILSITNNLGSTNK